MALTDESNGNGFYMPVAPAYGGGYGNNGGFGGFGGDLGWIILLLLCANGGWGGFGGFGGMSYARGDGRGRGRNAKRDSMGRYSSERGYSRDAADMTAELQEMMDDPKYEPIKYDIERLMRKVEQM